jgi:hypothetical protein
MSDDKVLPMSPDADLAAELRKDFTARHCVQALMKSAAEMAAAIGVTVSWDIVSVDDNKDVDRLVLSQALGRMATAGGAMLTGGKVNPISTLDAQNPMRILRDFRKQGT